MAIGDLKISGDGKPGEDGKDGQGFDGHAREPGVNALNGEDGTKPTDGKNAQTVHVSFKRAHPGSSAPLIVVTVDKHDGICAEPQPHTELKEEFTHDLGTEGNITVSACGGAGGRGGSGGNGQGGGHGRNGQNATVDMSGTNGGPGGSGGAAGDGTSGANGGKAAEIRIFIKEEDMDLLLALNPPKVEGGRAGKAGVNGIPGPGGDGGRGGGAYTDKTITRVDGVTREITHHNLGGQSGPGGKTGEPSSAALIDGKKGKDGQVHIFVEMSEGQIAGPYESAYQLEVSEFEVVDGNEDEILEFGEDITLRSIRVSNSGGSPSPKASQVVLEGESTDWLVAPRTTHNVPRSVMSGAALMIDGKITYRVRRPKDFPAGRPFSVEDAFKLRAHMSGIDRDMRDFHSPKRITLQHPIEMSKPKYLRCLTVGQEAVFSWKVTNKSSKDLGVESPSGREIKFNITQPGDSALQLGPSHAESFEIPIKLLAAGESKDVQLMVKVPRSAETYTKTELHVSLRFTTPDKSELSTIQTNDLPLQISNCFRHSPEAKVLLVTNYETSADDVEMWHQMIYGRFGMKMDVWNICVNGHLELLGGPRNVERQSLFQLYKGKTIIMLGNRFSYFGRGQRTAMDLIDPKDFVPATFGGTNLFISAMNVDKNQSDKLIRLLRANSYQNSREYIHVKELVAATLGERHETSFYNTQYVCLPTPKGVNAQRCSSKANRAASELLKRLPHHRFMISWTAVQAGDKAVNNAGKVEVWPCTPYDRSKFILTRPVPDNRAEEMNEFAVLLSLPFATKLEMLWNELGEKVGQGKHHPQSLAEIVQVDMITELARFVTIDPPWPDCIEKPEVLTYLPRINEFLDHNRGQQFSRESLNRVIDMLGDLSLMADCCPGSLPRKVTIATRRKNLWEALLKKIDEFIKVHYGHLGGKANPAKAQYVKYVTEERAQTLNESPGGRKARILKRVTAKVPIYVGSDFSDSKTGVVDFETLGNVVRSQTEAAAWKQTEWSNATRLEEDLAHAKEEVTDDMSRLPGYSV